MLTTNTTLIAAFKEKAREITGGVYVYTDSAISQTISPEETLVSIMITRSAPAGKFFGFAIAQEMKVEVLGKISLAKGTQLYPYIKVKGQEAAKLPFFYVDSISIDETKNKSIITAYDIIGSADNHLIKNTVISYPLTLSSFAGSIAQAIGGTVSVDFEGRDITITEGNFNGTETLRSVLASIAEATGTVCYCKSGHTIAFKTLSDTVNDTLDGSNYFDFSAEDGITLTQIAANTQLGDNVTSGEEGYTQVFWDNPFLELRDDKQEIIDAIASKILGITLIPYNLSWRGNPFYEFGDCIEVTTVKGGVKKIYFFNETLIYSGGLKSTSEWVGGETEDAEAAPTSISVLKQTYAKVDKINQTIELVAQESSEVKEEMSALKVETDGIFTEVRQTQSTLFDNIESVNENIDSVNKKIQTAITADNISIEIQKELVNGVTSVTTSTGFTFDEEGLTISKTGTEMSTQITEDGMTVYRDNTAVLVANNIGVEATNLYAKTYLIIGQNSRLEDYNGNRTGCFWIGDQEVRK